MSRKFAIAGVQMFVQAGAIEKNLQLMEDYIQHVATAYPFVEMILFSELCLYGVPFKQWKRAAEAVPGPLTERLCALSKKYKKWLVPGSLYERVNRDIYNTSIAISPDGEIIAKYRKLFPWQPLEETTPGKDFCVFEVPQVGKFGLCICYDMWFPEVCRTLAWMGAEVILHPTMTTTADREQELILARANAIFNQCYFLDINGTGYGGVGRSMLVDPHGRVLQTTQNEAALLIETLDLDTVDTVRKFGTAGVSRVLQQFKDFPLKFPVYEMGISTGEGFRNLGLEET